MNDFTTTSSCIGNCIQANNMCQDTKGLESCNVTSSSSYVSTVVPGIIVIETSPLYIYCITITEEHPQFFFGNLFTLSTI